MAPRLNASAMVVFAEVVAAGSFSAAAARLGLSNASVSREVARLERRLGAQLLRRTTRKMSLTEVGEAFYARCQRVVDETEQAASSVGESQAEPRGEIRLAAPMSFGHHQIAARLPAFLQRYPEVRVHVELTDRMVDLVSEQVRPRGAHHGTARGCDLRPAPPVPDPLRGVRRAELSQGDTACP